MTRIAVFYIGIFSNLIFLKRARVAIGLHALLNFSTNFDGFPPIAPSKNALSYQNTGVHGAQIGKRDIQSVVRPFGNLKAQTSDFRRCHMGIICPFKIFTRNFEECAVTRPIGGGFEEPGQGPQAHPGHLSHDVFLFSAKVLPGGCELLHPGA